MRVVLRVRIRRTHRCRSIKAEMPALHVLYLEVTSYTLHMIQPFLKRQDSNPKLASRIRKVYFPFGRGILYYYLVHKYALPCDNFPN